MRCDNLTNTILITGGTGFVGSFLCKKIIETTEYNVKIFDKKCGKKMDNFIQENSQRMRFIRGDIREFEEIKTATIGVEKVIHLAAITSVQESMSNPELTIETNVNGSKNLIKACLETDVKRVVFASSAAIYGENQSLPIKEQDAGLFPLISPYAESKLANEIDIHALSGDTICSIGLRFFNIYGHSELFEEQLASVIPAFVEKIRQRQSPSIYGNGSATRDFVHLSDVHSAIMRALVVDKANLNDARNYNIASGNAVSMLELVNSINIQMSQIEENWISVSHEISQSRQGDISHSCADITLARDNLSWTPKVKLEEGLKEMLLQSI